MKRSLYYFTGFALTTVVLLSIMQQRTDSEQFLSKTPANYTKMPYAERKAGREEHFYLMLRDPATDQIPKGIRDLELSWYKEFSERFKSISSTEDRFTWEVGGPYDVGGRTRGIGVDLNNSNTVIAGGVSGGIWKTTNAGASWELKTPDYPSLAVTALAQDPRENHRNIWYAGTGEYTGNSASARGGGATFFGQGLWKSTDNGETWTRIQGVGNPIVFDNEFDFVWEIKVHPVSGDVYVATAGFGILRSSDGGANFSLSLGARGQFYWIGLDIATNGKLIATLSTGSNAPENPPGFFISDNGGTQWHQVNPASLPAAHRRSIPKFAPSNSDIVYMLTFTGATIGGRPQMLFWRGNVSGTSVTWLDRTANLPNFGDPVGFMEPQGGYNMMLAVKPDDAGVVYMGLTNLYRSRDAFLSETKPPAGSDNFTILQYRQEHWIGGYAIANNISVYNNHHPDQHNMVFDPANPNAVWSAHDGGISYTSNINAVPIIWTSKNNGYLTTQFYTVSIPKDNGTQVAGGTQDNGTPYFNTQYPQVNISSDISSGDGSYVHFGQRYVFSSSQRGRVLRHTHTNNVPNLGQWSIIRPTNAANQLFIHPYVIDPLDDDIIYYPDANTLWRNLSISTIPNFQNTTSIGWQLLSAGIPSSYTITTLASSTTNPRYKLYLGASDIRNLAAASRSKPAVYVINSGVANPLASVERILEAAPNGGYVHSIGVNPGNGDELLVSISNYNAESIFYSSDAGTTFTPVQGNLAGNEINPGPSVRVVRIMNYQGQKLFIAGTSAGLYVTNELNGNNTIWRREAEELIGSSVIEYLDFRENDGRIAVASHGRGIFIGTAKIMTNTESQPELAGRFELLSNYPNPFNPTTMLRVNLPELAQVTLRVYDVNGRLVRTLLQDATISAGLHEQMFDARSLASGTYLYTVQATGSLSGKRFFDSGKMTLLK